MVRFEMFGGISERSTNNLLYRSGMEVNARAESGHAAQLDENCSGYETWFGDVSEKFDTRREFRHRLWNFGFQSNTKYTIEDGIDKTMAIILGKRKRVHRVDLQRRSSSPESSQNSGREDLQAIFKRHFEAKFKPLDPEPEKTKVVEQVEDVPDEDEDSDWEGINSGEEAAVEVIEHSASRVINERARKDELKAFMVKLQAMCVSHVAKYI